MKNFSQRHSHLLHSTLSHSEFQHPSPLPSFKPLFKLEENQGTSSFDQTDVDNDYLHNPATQLQLADLELGLSWPAGTGGYPQMLQYSHLRLPIPNVRTGVAFVQQLGNPISPLQPAYHFFDDAILRTPWSSPEFSSCRPVPTGDDEEDMIDDKPYARLIYDALMQAPDHRMMLRDIYEWFRKNTTKAQDNATNGWQNSIRHNLSMNKAFENDREQGRGSARKANSVWALTGDAILHGVQSTTRYRKSGGGRRTLISRTPALQRQKSGARGGRAARRSARYRHQDQVYLDHPTPSSCSPDTPSYSDVSDSGFDNPDFHPGFRSCPLTPLEGQSQLTGDTIQQVFMSPWDPSAFDSHRSGYDLESTSQVRDLLLQPSDNQYMGCIGDLHTSAI
ncbi:hypothetical protein LTR84_006329 [Exophiala bonariae]|uniref:Fork-head domain-containing protein n=1 Tax=Exophiala bonariae TaxID=1690606 RepID=A0AAV9N4D5_9EURO|nr:hypothetical protein LTR84_006329 [Exophiala bonariae]